MAAGPLQGIRVVDLTRVWAGPLGTRILADLGADVIKVEAASGRGVATPRPGQGHYPDGEPGDRPWNRQGSFNKLSRNKRSLVLDLKADDGRAIFLELVAQSDLVVENFSAGTMDDLGLGYEALRGARPDIVYLSMPGFGSSGPYRNYVAYGPSIEPKTGLPWLFGYGEGEPHVTGLALPDATAGTVAAAAACTALARRRLTGLGAHVDMSQQEGFIGFLAGPLTSFQTEPGYAPIAANRSRMNAPSGVFPCAGEDQWIAIEVADDRQWRALAALLGGQWAGDAELQSASARLARQDEIEDDLRRWTRAQEPEVLSARLATAGVPAAPVADAAALLADRHLNARGFFVTLDHVDAGPKPYPGSPVEVDGTRHDGWHAAPTLGEHNHEILAELLGRSAGQITSLHERGVIADRPPDG